MAFETAYKPPTGMGVASLTDWLEKNRANIKNEWQNNYNQWSNKVQGARASLTEWQNAWTPMKWEGSEWQTRYQGQQAGMDDLAAQIRNYGWDSSDPNVAQYVAGLYGMTPEQWASMQSQNAQRMADPNFAAESDASAANAYLSNLANSSFMQEQDKANRVAMRQAEDAIGKQLEAVFGERGGMGGFQAAYELTSQLQSSFLQQRTQQNLGIFNQAVAAVNANNQYFQNLIQQGAISGKEYLQFRFDQLQTGYQNYMMSMAQTMQEWQTLEQVDEAQFNQVSANIQSQIDNMTNTMIEEMGGYANAEEYFNAISDEYLQGPLAREAVEEENGAKATAVGTGLIATAGAVAAIPGVGWIFAIPLLLGGLAFTVYGATR